jgi:hypothetical protein
MASAVQSGVRQVLILFGPAALVVVHPPANPTRIAC